MRRPLVGTRPTSRRVYPSRLAHEVVTPPAAFAVPCHRCGAVAGAPCVSMARKTIGAPQAWAHHVRGERYAAHVVATAGAS